MNEDGKEEEMVQCSDCKGFCKFYHNLVSMFLCIGVMLCSTFMFLDMHNELELSISNTFLMFRSYLLIVMLLFYT